MSEQTQFASDTESEPLTPTQEYQDKPISKPTCDLSVLDLHDPTPFALVKLFEQLHDHHSHELEFNRTWNSKIATLTFCAQRIINRSDEHSRPTFDLFRAAGIKVTMPNVFRRMLYRFQRMKRAELYKKKLAAQELRSKVNLETLRVSELEIRSLAQTSKYSAVRAKKEEETQTAEVRLYTLQKKEEEKRNREANGRAIIELSEAIQERITEDRKKDETNNKIRAYNALIEAGHHNLDPEKWKKMKYFLLDGK